MYIDAVCLADKVFKCMFVCLFLYLLIGFHASAASEIRPRRVQVHSSIRVEEHTKRFHIPGSSRGSLAGQATRVPHKGNAEILETQV